MLKKSLPLILLLVCSGLVYFAYISLKSEADLSKDPIESIPQDAAIIIKSKNIKNVYSKLSETNLVYNAFLSFKPFSAFNQKLKSIDSLINCNSQSSDLLDNKSAYVSLHNGDGIQFFAALNATSLEFENLCSLFPLKDQIKSFKIGENKSSKVFTIAENQYYICFYNPFILVSSDASLINKSMNQLAQSKSITNDSEFQNLYSAHNSNIGTEIFINGKRAANLASKFLKKNHAETLMNESFLPSWFSLDLNEKSNTLIVNGLSTSNAKSSVFFNANSQDAQATQSLWLLPTDLLRLERNSISELELFITENSKINISSLEEQCTCNPITAIKDWVGNEFISICFGNETSTDNAYFIKSKGYQNLVGQLNYFGVKDSISGSAYGTDFYPVKNKDILKLFGVVDTISKNYFFAEMNDFAIFSTFKGLSKIAYQWKASNASIPNNKFINFAQDLMSNFSSIDKYYNWDEGLRCLKPYFKNEYQSVIEDLGKNLSSIEGIIWQISQTKTNNLYHSLAINTSQANEASGPVEKLWNVSMQENVLGIPQVMKNHQTGTQEVVLQDKNFNIHLISAAGKIKWFKSINEPIIGSIKQVDIYKNGKYQMLFNTANKIHLIDVNGNQVTGFPIKIPSAATNEVAVFDYDNNGNFRFIISTIDGKIRNFNKEGKPVDGWNEYSMSNISINKTEHFVLDNKDYLCTHDISGNIYLLNRKGELRNLIKDSIASIDKSQIYLQRGSSFGTTKFIYRDSSDRFEELTLNGTRKNFSLDSSIYNYNFWITDIDKDRMPDYVVTFNNKLSIYGPDKIEFFQEIFDFNINRNFRLIEGKQNYPIIANEENELIHLYNYQFKPIAGFPIPGSIKSTIGDLNKDGQQEIITIVDGKTVVCYTLNQLYGI